MPKIFDNKEIQERRLNEDKWFFINQPLLLWLANTDYGRDLLCIPKQYNEIIDIKFVFQCVSKIIILHIYY